MDATDQLFVLSKKSKPPVNGRDDAHSPIDLLVDAIVGMLEASSAFGRAVATQAFGMLSGLVEGSTIDLVLMVRVDLGYQSGRLIAMVCWI